MSSISGLSSDPAIAGASGENDGTGGVGVLGVSTSGDGLRAISKTGNGLSSFSDSSVGAFARSGSGDGVLGVAESAAKSGVFGSNESTSPATSPGGSGVFGLTVAPGAAGVFGANSSAAGRGVQGNGPEVGVGGFSEHGTGVLAQSPSGDGLVSTTWSAANSGVFASNESTSPATSPGGSGVFGLTVAPGAAGVFGANNSAAGHGVQGNGPEVGVGGFSEHGTGVLAQGGQVGLKAQAPLAGRFEGDVEVTGDIRLVNGDRAEDFDVAVGVTLAPGTVVCLDHSGAVRASRDAYDQRVAGIVAGAGSYQPAIVLDRRPSDRPRVPVALIGKAICRVDASDRPIRAGDLLTTSSREGYAMAAGDSVDRTRLVGAVVGKALAGLTGGVGEIPVLVGLR